MGSDRRQSIIQILENKFQVVPDARREELADEIINTVPAADPEDVDELAKMLEEYDIGDGEHNDYRELAVTVLKSFGGSA